MTVSEVGTAHLSTQLPERGWYFRSTIDGVSGSLKTGPLPAIVARAGPRWKCTLDLEGLEPGWYSIVMCISFKNMDTKGLQSLTIDAKQLDDDDHPAYQAKTCRTTINSEELRKIPADRFVRLRLHRQIELDAAGLMELSFSFGQGAIGSFELRYVTLESGQTGVYDHVLYGDGKPQQFISIAHDQQRSHHGQTLNVHSYAISSSGSHAVTLYFFEDRAYLEVWDLRESREETASSTPRVRYIPIARISINAFTDSHPDLMNLSLSISSLGSQVVLHSAEQSEHGIPCHVFNCDPPAPAYHDMSKPYTLGLTTVCQEIKGFYGYGAFHFNTSESPNEKDERYITCDGSTVSVYSIQGAWSRIHTWSLGFEPNLDAALAMFLSMRGRYVAWTGVKGIVSVWDIVTGKQVAFIPLEDDYSSVFANMSRDGSLVAISVRGRVSVYQTFTGVKLGDYDPGLGDVNYFEVVLERDHLLVLDHPSSDSNDLDQIGCRRLVSTRDMSVVKTLRIHQDYEVQYPIPAANPSFAYAQGSVVNIVKVPNALAPLGEDSCDNDCVMDALTVDLFTEEQGLEYSTDGCLGAFNITTSQSRINGTRTTLITIKSGTSVNQRQFTIPLGPAHVAYSGVFVPMTSQLVLATGRYMQVWKLSTSSDAPIAELEFVWKLRDEGQEHSKDTCHRKVASASVCQHGHQVALDLYPERWFRKSKELPRVAKRNAIQTMTFPISAADNIGTNEAFRVNHGVQGLVELYAYGGMDCQQAVLRHLRTLVRPSSGTRSSAIVTLSRFWSPENKTYFEEIMTDLLPTSHVTWIPEILSEDAIDPLAVMLKTAENQPSAIGMAKIIMNYCISHANSSKNVSFMRPIFDSWRKITCLAPSEALNCLEGMAFIPVQQRSYIVNNHLIAYPPVPRWDFWKGNTRPLWKTRDPVMQLQVNPNKPNPLNEQFTQQVFSASYDSLWFQRQEIPKHTEVSSLFGSRLLWWRALIYTAWLKLRLGNQVYIECKDSGLEFFDNPAITALVSFKWNTIGYKYWLVRFFFQCLYYILVTVVAILQVYLPDFRHLRNAFIAIIALSAVFLWLELSRAMRSWTRYKTPSYNVAGIFAYLLPMIAAIDQLVIITMTNLNGNAKILSFSVLAVFVNMLYELRINKMVCKYVMIIQRAIVEIAAFFLIFGVGIATFTIAILHVLHACPNGSCDGDPASEYPTQFFGALSTTFFFLAGRFGPINTELSSPDWSFRIMMILCYLFTNIVMMNVLISLFSMTFIKGDDYWRLTWLECRMHNIEAAENMSYHIKGFRDSMGYFPKEIYYTADPLAVKAFYQKQQARSQDIFKTDPKDEYGFYDGGSDDGRPESQFGHGQRFSQYERASTYDSGSTIHPTSPYNPPKGGGDSTYNEKHGKRGFSSYGHGRIGSVHSEAPTDLSAIAATLADMQKSITELREPTGRPDPRMVAYERGQARDMVDQWMEGRNEGDLRAPQQLRPPPPQPPQPQPVPPPPQQQQQQPK
ncbi:hypothetical protein BGX31_004179 [Mortierella sp. GBA43]|nr:hypothetical protein BGX31_004179 [Mortierella sp. GBA43]